MYVLVAVILVGILIVAVVALYLRNSQSHQTCASCGSLSQFGYSREAESELEDIAATSDHDGFIVEGGVDIRQSGVRTWLHSGRNSSRGINEKLMLAIRHNGVKGKCFVKFFRYSHPLLPINPHTLFCH